MNEDKKIVLITGVSGFIGSNMARYFAEQNWKVVGIDEIAVTADLKADLASSYKIKLPNQRLGAILKEVSPHLCIHCAGPSSVISSLNDTSLDFYSSTVLTFEVLNSIRLNMPTCHFIYLSSAAIYGNPQSIPIDENQPPDPISPYGFHKWQCELLCEEFTKVYGMSTSIVRVFSAYGPGLRRQVIWDICEKVIKHKSIMLHGTGQESRDFIHVIDIAKALMTVATYAPMHGEIYNIASGRETRINDLAEIIVNALNVHHPIEFDGIVPPGTPLNWQANLSKIAKLGYTPSLSLEEGIKAFAEWCRQELEGS